MSGPTTFEDSKRIVIEGEVLKVLGISWDEISNVYVEVGSRKHKIEY